MLRIHFLNVGHGDCCIVEFLDAGRTAIIDINKTEDMDKDSAEEVVKELSSSDYQFVELSKNIRDLKQDLVFKKIGYDIELQNPIEYLTDKGIDSAFRFISTHPHMDHLSGLKELKTEKGIVNFWVLENEFTQDIDELNDSQKEDWELYTSLRDATVNKKDDITIIRALEGDSRSYWDEDAITILAPNKDLVENAQKKKKQNKMSYVLMIEYKGEKIVLGGDAEEETWKYLTENYEDDLKDVTILKASHHGRDSGYYQPAVKLMNPEHTIVSVGKKPSTDASNKYKQYCDDVCSTRWNGNIVFEIDDNGQVSCEKQYDR